MQSLNTGGGGHLMDEAMEWIVLFKRAVIGIGTIGVLLFGVFLLVQTQWVAAAIVLLAGPPVWYVAADLATGLLVAPIVGWLYVRDRNEYDGDDPTSWM